MKVFFLRVAQMFASTVSFIYLREKKKKDELKGCGVFMYGNAYVYG